MLTCSHGFLPNGLFSRRQQRQYSVFCRYSCTPPCIFITLSNTQKSQLPVNYPCCLFPPGCDPQRLANVIPGDETSHHQGRFPYAGSTLSSLARPGLPWVIMMHSRPLAQLQVECAQDQHERDENACCGEAIPVHGSISLILKINISVC